MSKKVEAHNDRGRILANRSGHLQEFVRGRWQQASCVNHPGRPVWSPAAQLCKSCSEAQGERPRPRFGGG